MTRNPVMNLWTAIVATFLALCTSLGLITTTAVAAPLPDAEPTRNSKAPQDTKAPEEPIRAWPHTRSLPPTMKQRIHAEAHGSSPSCRNRPLTDTRATATATATATTPATTTTTTAADIAVPAPVGPSGTTRSASGHLSTDVSEAAPAAAPEGGTTASHVGTATAAATCTPTAPVTPTAPASPAGAAGAAGNTGHAGAPVPRTTGLLPSQSSGRSSGQFSGTVPAATGPAALR